MLRGMLLGYAMVLVSASATAQPMRASSGAGAGSTDTRYFQLTLDLKSPGSLEGQPQLSAQSIMTEVAVSDGKPGSCRTRMTSQIPVSGSDKPIDIGTRFDCNNIHLEGDGLALSIVLDMSRITGKVSTKNRDGVEVEEPIISERKLELSVKLPLGTPKVVFDSSSETLVKPLKALQKGSELPPSYGAPKRIEVPTPPLQIEMTATELK